MTRVLTAGDHITRNGHPYPLNAARLPRAVIPNEELLHLRAVLRSLGPLPEATNGPLTPEEMNQIEKAVGRWMSRDRRGLTVWVYAHSQGTWEKSKVYSLHLMEDRGCVELQCERPVHNHHDFLEGRGITVSLGRYGRDWKFGLEVDPPPPHPWSTLTQFQPLTPLKIFSIVDLAGNVRRFQDSEGNGFSLGYFDNFYGTPDKGWIEVGTGIDALQNSPTDNHRTLALNFYDLRHHTLPCEPASQVPEVPRGTVVVPKVSPATLTSAYRVLGSDQDSGGVVLEKISIFGPRCLALSADEILSTKFQRHDPREVEAIIKRFPDIAEGGACRIRFRRGTKELVADTFSYKPFATLPAFVEVGIQRDTRSARKHGDTYKRYNVLPEEIVEVTALKKVPK